MDLQKRLEQLQEKFQKITGQLDRDKLRGEIKELETQMGKPNFWQEAEKAQKISQDLSSKQKLLEKINGLERQIQGISGLTSDESLKEEVKKELSQVEKSLNELELQLFLSDPHDSSESIISIHAGTGGVEAMEWTAMLARMYQRFFDSQGWEYEISDESFGEEAGYKSISMIVHAPFAYGYLKGESGTHRLVRQSPFNADHLRQTSFALVEVLPIIEDETEVEIKQEDLEFEAFRASSHGGQNVNKVSTAVRLKHIPTGITVTAQTERSQLQNRENALEILRAKVWALQEVRKEEERTELKGDYRQASWGNQIRSYVLHPYHLIKDLRTGTETGDTESFLDGSIMKFLEAKLRLDKKLAFS